jgi:hypothetical protein
MCAFEVSVPIAFTPKSPHLVRVFPHEWDEYSVERVRGDRFRTTVAGSRTSDGDGYSVSTVVQLTPSSLDKTRWFSPSRTTR